MEGINWGYVLSLITIIVSIGGGILSGIVTVSMKMAKYEQKVDDLKDDKIAAFSKIDTLRTDVDTLKEFRNNAQKFIDKNLYESRSPLQLSPFGKKIVEESGFIDIFEKNKKELAIRLEKKAPKTKYDVQELARALMDELGDHPAFQPIKPYAFKNGLDFLQILRAGSILLRDYYLTLHTEIER